MEKSRYLDIIFERVPEGLAIIDAEKQRVVLVSRYAARIVGRSREELEGATEDDLIERWDIFKSDGVSRPKKEEFPIFRTLTKGECIENEEWIFRKPNGARVCILMNACPVFDEGEVTGSVISWVDISERKANEEKLRVLNVDLNEALRKVKVLSGMMTVCASCKRIQDDRGHWETIEKYIAERSEAEFSHSICPDCAQRLYGDSGTDDIS
ncbi:MAG TPA: hypothetical protein DDW94_04850 [Deltaproteobacteria bacterium]|nr:MAG: hypothetical protein A2Z79_00225 [Deltaproteobacteria bacterium GWA2_55_82]OGQ64941.1 MAG: hypothetical protein A3I81_01645 [Deltaproteobacteria bacterium RIFCSPLOWO2_02_FULL_55_12]OIJ73879.1 MAG: hypothetical protein A2V21_306130 [Deltaproteobacteria bacterium GWC2_55_46]HBG46301.1 hypothetical protein [Deltaproteobacteria bacterium]HCY09869.1 hypothetical protein [Deltaproteobacteria bacterium]